MPEAVPVGTVPVAQQVARRALPRERLNDLVRRPRGGWAAGHVDAEDAPTVMGQDYEDEEYVDYVSWL